MLLCKACNTRFEDGRSACPNCGRRVFASVSEAPKTGEPEPLPLASATSIDAPAPPASRKRRAREAAQASEGGLHELSEVDVLAEAVDPALAEELKRETPVRSPRPRGRSLETEPGPAVFHLSAAQIRTLVAEQPELLEPDLAIYRDEKKDPVGVDFRTPVGAIDLLARDPDGGFVVVDVPDPRDVDMLMPEILARIGYVRKHLATDGRNVRGIVVIEEIPEELAYAAAGVAQTVSFKAFRVALTFHDLPL
jgi:predicted  nucleic acid-binding Zn-ribbon protein